jgi:quercetin dioxygenase-like cupin family protein
VGTPQCLGKEKRVLGPGDCVFIPPEMVHASFNAGEGKAKVVVILSPCVGDVGFEAVDMSNKALWKTVRG